MRAWTTHAPKATGPVPGARHGALRVALIYIVVSALWIFFSDYAVGMLTSDPAMYREISTLKGWGFVLATGAGLFLLVRRELSARRGVEQELRRANESLGALVKEAPLAVCATDRAGLVESWNPAAERVFGWSAGEVLGRPLPVAFDAKEARMDAVRERVLNGESVHFDGTGARHRDGRPIKLDLWCAPLHDSTLQAVGMMVVAQDVTEHRRAEEALRASEVRFRLLIETAPLGIVMVRDGRIGFANASLASMFGCTGPLEMIARPITDFVPEWRETEVQAADAHGLRDGRTFPIRLLPEQIQLADGPATVGFLTDLTAQHEAAEALRESEERLLQAQKMEAIGRLAGGLAHDLNNLLTAIIGFSDLMLDDLGPESPHRPGAREILKAADRAAALTRQLLAFSRKQVLRPRAFDLNDVVRSLLPMLERLIGADVEVVCRLDEGLRPVLADPAQIEQVVMNLAVNARDAMPEGGTLTITTARGSSVPHGMVCLRVTDTGVGMPPEVQAHLFEPYFTTKESGKGTGLGLSTVYGIVTQSGGQVEVTSAPGEGATFEIILPAAAEGPLAAPEPVEATGPAGGSETILVVEDERAVRQLVRDVLSGHGFNVLVAESAARALEIAGAYDSAIDLLVTDVVMPGIGGQELARQLQERLPQLRVLFVSGYMEDPDVESGTRHPGTGFLAKPFTPRALLSKVRHTLSLAN